jgi:Fe-S cluster biogenesis protein NfuA
MFIQTEATPNPLTVKFIPGVAVMPSGTVDFRTLAEVNGQSELATRLFALKGVDGVFLGSDFVSITKLEAIEWTALKPLILGTLFEFFSSGKSAYNQNKIEINAEPDSDIVIEIKELLEARVRPAVAQDGGDVVFHSFEKGILYLEMRGACSGCPSSAITLKNGIETMMRHYVPEVLEVRQATL